MGPDKETTENWRDRLYTIIFEADTPLGKGFDVALIISIILSVMAVMLDSVPAMNQRYGDLLYSRMVFHSSLFCRIFIENNIYWKAWALCEKFFRVIDLLAVLPTYISLLIPGSQYLIVIRILRILRIFRVLKLAQYIQESQLLMKALKASRRKIEVFLFAVLTLVVIFGSLMYLIEGEESGFTSIPRGIYWAIVTLTTVGYGDISPMTGLGQSLAAVIMIMGYGIIAVPTGIVTVELSQARAKRHSLVCAECSSEDHDQDAKYCKDCGAKFPAGP